jgi:hypothetical protein
MFDPLTVLAIEPDLGTRGIWLAMAVLTALMVGLVTGGLSWVDNRRTAAAVMRGGCAFSGTVCFVLAIYAFLLLSA